MFLAPFKDDPEVIEINDSPVKRSGKCAQGGSPEFQILAFIIRYGKGIFVRNLCSCVHGGRKGKRRGREKKMGEK